MGKKSAPAGLEDLKKGLRELPIRVTAAYLIGSRARGDWLEDSDWDLQVVSPDFVQIDYLERMRKLMEWLPFFHVDYFCYTPDEFRQRAQEPGFIRHALDEAVQIIG